jgi:hypothetical protein
MAGKHVEPHPTDPDKVVVWDTDPETGAKLPGTAVASDNLDGLFDPYLIEPPEHGDGVEYRPHREESD